MAAVTTEAKTGIVLDGTVPLTPEALSSQLRIDHPRTSVAIMGIAQDVRPFRKDGRVVRVYGRLVLGGYSIGFSAPRDGAPEEGEAVVMNGSLSIQAANPDFEWRATHKVVLKGHVVANWTPRQSDEDFEEIPSRTERIPLYDFASRHSLQELVVLCSGTAQTDITASLQRAGVDERPQFITANFTDESDFLNKVESLHGTFGVSALAVARGGGGGIDKIGNSRKIARALVESRMPFYVAIGHATDVVLLDKVADQAFHSPSELGASWARALNDRARQADQQKRIADIERRLADEQSAASEIAAQLSSWQDRLKRLACLHRYGISISWWGLFLALAGLGLWGWFRYFD